jgi:FlaA1/EpsC-like NDP-sugar epimerase
MTNIVTNIYRSISGFTIRNRRTFVTFVHLLQAVVACYLAFLLRFEGIIPEEHFSQMVHYLPYLLVIRLVFYRYSGLHKDLWRYSSVSDLIKIVRSVILGSVAFFLLVRTFFGDVSYPRSIYILDALILILISGGTRLMIRIFREYLQSESSGKKTLLIGAGDAGEMIVRDMKNNPQYAYQPIGFIDEDKYKVGLTIHGIPIFGTNSMIGEVIEKYTPEEIIICIPSASNKAIRQLFELCKPYNIPIKTLPGMSDILRGDVSVSQIKPLSLEDLLHREPVQTDLQSIKDYIKGKSVLVTGAGGSIGSELARQIIKYHPSRLIILDRYENGLFSIDMELRKAHSLEDISTVIGDILDTSRMDYVFSKFRPQIVFHAAAHKHVPMMEHNPIESVKNNVFGTKCLIEASSRYDVESFVMISTDKAVNPTSIMGATKRVAEFLSLVSNPRSSTKFTTVRFGNVLGSNGSVVHIFKEQIKQGGPLTITHPEIKRFFMLIPEAVQLVLIAAASGKGGEIFVLDMGEPVRIVDFAENLIRLSGLVPNEDIKMEFTGLRMGEKLYEELFDKTETVAPASHDKLKIAVPFVPAEQDLMANIDLLEEVVRESRIEDIIPTIQKIVPGFTGNNNSN